MATRKKSATDVIVTEKSTPTTTTRAPSVDVYVEAYGRQISVKEVTKAVKDVVGNAKKCKVYIKPEDGKAYIVADGNQLSIEL